MPKVVGNRIYLECDIAHKESYRTEMLKVIEMGLNKHVVIWDQSCQEPPQHGLELFDIYVSPNRANENGVKIFDRNIWIKLVCLISKNAMIAQVGCWKEETELIEEIHKNFSIIDIQEYGKQMEYQIEYNRQTEEYLMNNYKNSEGRVKWFNFSLSDNQGKNIFVSSHFGEEMYFSGLSASDVERAIALVEHNDIYVRINRHICL